MFFESTGPFAFPRNRTGRWQSDFWDEVTSYWEGLDGAVGCYAFSLSMGGKPRPWYVGKTLAAGGFRAEIFEKHKLNHYDEVLAARRGAPQIVLFPLVTDSWQLSWNISSGRRTVDWLERTLIGMAISKNPAMRNQRDTKFLREVYVNGVLGGQYSGRPSAAATFAKKLLLAE